MPTNCDKDAFNDSLLLAEKEAVLPAGSILPGVLEAGGILLLGAADAGAAVGVALAIGKRKSLQIHVRWRIRMRRRRSLRFGWRRGCRRGCRRRIRRRRPGRGRR